MHKEEGQETAEAAEAAEAAEESTGWRLLRAADFIHLSWPTGSPGLWGSWI